MDLTELQKSELTTLEETSNHLVSYRIVGEDPRTGTLLMECVHPFRLTPDGVKRQPVQP